MPNTAFGTPYVSSSDYVTNYPTVSQSLANSIDTMSGGVIASVKNSSLNQTGITTTVDVTSMSISVPQISGRTYLYQVQIEVYVTSTDTVPAVLLTDSANTQLHRGTMLFPTANASATLGFFFYETAGSTATVTRKLRAGRAVGTGNVALLGGSTTPAQLICHDLGT